MIRLQPRSTHFPYTTRFRSLLNNAGRRSRTRLACHSRTTTPLTRQPSYNDHAHRLEVIIASLPWPIRSSSAPDETRSEEHTSELQSHLNLVCRLLLYNKSPA